MKSEIKKDIMKVKCNRVKNEGDEKGKKKKE